VLRMGTRGGGEREEEGEQAGLYARIRHVLSASGLPKMDMNGKADPYVVLRCGRDQAQEQRSKVVPKTLSPVWDDARFQWSAVEGSEELVVRMFDQDRGSKDDPMGEVRVKVSEMDGQERAYKLQPMAGCKAPKGEVMMRCSSVASAAASAVVSACARAPCAVCPAQYARSPAYCAA
jgi:hypothetical protein